MPWVNDNIQDMYVVIKTFLDQVNRITDDLNQQRFSDLLQRPLLAELTPLWKDFLEHLRHNSGELAAFWMAYIAMVEDILIGILRASCEGNWNLHLHAVRNMIPWQGSNFVKNLLVRRTSGFAKPLVRNEIHLSVMKSTCPTHENHKIKRLFNVAP